MNNHDRRNIGCKGPFHESPSLTLSIIIPAYNEENRIRHTLTEYIGFFESKYDDDFEIVVITDGCMDKTCGIIDSFHSPMIKHYNYRERMGKGGAISRGFEMSQGRIISYTDADCSTPPKQLHDLIEVLKVLDCDGISASRYAAGGRILRKQPLGRKMASRAFNMIVWILFRLPYKDTQCGAKVFKYKVAKEIFEDLKVTDWAFDVNILYNAYKRGFDVREVGIQWKNNGGSHLNMWKVVPKMFLSVLRLRLLETKFTGLVDNKVMQGIGRRIKKGMDGSHK